MTKMENDFGGVDYCIRCKKDIHIYDFHDKNEIDAYLTWGLCSFCQEIIKEENN